MKPEKPRCKEAVWSTKTSFGRYVACPNAAGPSGYCGTHDPERKRAREEAQPKCEVPGCGRTLTRGYTKYCRWHATVSVPRESYIKFQQSCETLEKLDNLNAELRRRLIVIAQEDRAVPVFNSLALVTFAKAVMDTLSGAAASTVKAVRTSTSTIEPGKDFPL